MKRTRNHKMRRQLQRESRRSAAVQDRDFGTRAAGLRAATVNEQDRSVETTITTDTPVPMFDPERWDMVPEVLRMDGVQLPANGQVPFLDSHNRRGIANQLGSARNMRVEGNSLVGRVYFSSAHASEFGKVKEGHVTDVSAGYSVENKTFVPEGTKAIVMGREYQGPVNVVTKWKLREVSLVPIGADELAKLRGYDPRQPKREVFTVNPELRKALVARGMPADYTDEQAQQWQLDQLRKADEEKAKADKERAEKEAKERDAGKSKSETPDLGKLVADALAAERAQRAEFRKSVDDICELADIDAAERSALYDLIDVAAVRTKVKDLKAQRTANFVPGAPIIPGPAQLDKHRAAVGTALNLRAIEAVAKPETIERLIPAAQRAAGYEQFRNLGVLELARECLEMDGIRTRGMSRPQIAMAALGFTDKAGVRSVGQGAYHTTGSFTKLTQDAVNKSMQVGYTEYPATWRICFRQGESAQDLKTIHRIRMGAVPNLPDWPTNKAPAEISLLDSEETYKVQPKSLKISFSWDLLVNDDMSMLSRVPVMFGNAAARTVNAVAWAQITGNPTLASDSVALFATATGNRKRTNLTTGAGAPSVSTIQTLTNLMMQMRGENTPEQVESQDILGLMPRYIVGPSALRTTILQTVLSIADPASTNQNTYNPSNNLIPVIEPLLDAASTTAWYLFADSAQIDTVEVTFLQGYETPQVRDHIDPETMAQNFYVLQPVAAKALNHRGVQKHAGA